MLVFTAFLILLPNYARAADWIYVVSTGDNLWDISKRYLRSATDWSKVQKINQLQDPNWVKPGTRLRIPMSWIAENSVGAAVSAAQGRCTVLRSDGLQETLAAGAELHLGDRVQTFDESTLAITFADSSIVILDANSVLALDHLSAYGNTGMVDSRLRLLKGRLETDVESAKGPGSRFEIHTASAISAVRGTHYRMSASEEDAKSRIEVTGGIVDVASSSAVSNVELNRGYGSVVEAGQAPLPPQALLEAPSLISLPNTLSRANWTINWTPVPGAEGYRARLADSASFETIQWQLVTSDTSLKLPALSDGTYYLRIRAIDALGLEGLEHEAMLIQAAYPEPPLPLNPSDGSTFTEQLPAFTWARSDEAASYHLQVARDADFNRIVFDVQNTATTQFESTDQAAPGDWYWRVASTTKDDKTGPFGGIRHFEISPKPTTPNVEAKSTEKDITLSWRGDRPGETYRVQIARDRDFRNIVSDKTQTKTDLLVKYARGSERYVRIQTIDANGHAAAWGAVQEIPAGPGHDWKVVLGAILVAILIAL